MMSCPPLDRGWELIASMYEETRGEELLTRTKNGKQAIICSVPEEHFEEVEKIRQDFNDNRPFGHGKVRCLAFVRQPIEWFEFHVQTNLDRI